MGLHDHALIVGINKYPQLTNLDGPEADATAFRDWLRDDARVQVPASQIKLLLSSDYPPAGGTNLARPIAVDVENELKQHIDRGDANGGVAGDRLYLYFAGHGMAPDLDEVALLMANAGRRNPGDHIGGRRYAYWFRQAAMFKEIVLVMDCCREPALNAPPKAPPWGLPPNVIQPVQYFYAFATSWPSAAREAANQGGAVRGVFTEVLLDGLSGRKIAPNGNGDITARMVEGWVLERFEQLADPDATVERQQPKFDGDPRDTFVLLHDATAPAAAGVAPVAAGTRATVRIKRKDNGPGNQIEVFDHAKTKLAGGGAQNGTFEISLPAGWYKATAPGGLSDLFEVTEAGGTIDVTL